MIEILPTGLHCIEGDTHMSKWIKDAGGVIDRGSDAVVQACLANLKPGDVVFDVGCNIGAYSRVFSDAIGPKGYLYGFDPNPECITCALANRGLSVTMFHNVACGLRSTMERLQILPNVGASYVGSVGIDVEVVVLDEFMATLHRLDLMKIDVEGMEPETIMGSRDLILRFRPKLVIEVNHGALQRRGHDADGLFSLLALIGYRWDTIPFGVSLDSPQYDILCTPRS